MAKKIYLAIVVLAVFYSVSINAAPRIRTISFEGNLVTQESLLLREMYVAVGDELDEAKVQTSVQAIMDLGLFKSVHYYLAEDYIGIDPEKNVVDLVILLEEKFYLLIIPRVRVSDETTTLGMQLRWDNVFGLNHSMNALYEDRGTTAGVHETRQRFIYNYPNVNGSRFSMSMRLTHANDVDENEIEGPINRKDEELALGIFKWLNPQGRNHGWYAGLGLNYRQRENLSIDGSIADDSIDAMVLELGYGYNKVHEYAYNRGGKAFGYNVDIADEALGGNSDYVKNVLFYRSYYRFNSRPDDNLNVQVMFGHANTDILGDAAFSLGSGDDLRGYDKDRFEGNTLLLMNIEYLRPMETYPSFRYVYFLDVGNTYAEISDIKHDALKTGAGIGFRWKLAAFVKVDLRVDVGYGFADEDYHISFGTRHIF
ncbi:MAG TPA: BamA/TamA family outer membrane protein [Gammaproteobacteria bacterium]